MALVRDAGAFVSRLAAALPIAALADKHDSARRSSWWATTARRETWRRTCARGWSRARSRYYPSRGVAYRVAPGTAAAPRGSARGALDALLMPTATEPRSWWSSARWPSSERSLTPRCARAQFRLKVGELLDLEECADELVAAGYERVDQVEERGQFAVRGRPARCLSRHRGASGARGHVRRGDREPAVVLDLHAALAGDVQEVEIAPAAELAAEHRELAEIAAFEQEREGERPDVAELLPVERFGALLDLIPARRSWWWRRRRSWRRRWTTTGAMSRAAFHDEDAHHLYVKPQDIHEALKARARIWLSALQSDQTIELRAQAADTAARTFAEAEPELEKLVRSGYRTVVAFPRRGGRRARRVQPRSPEGAVAGGGGGGAAREVGWTARSGGRPAPERRCASWRPRCARASSRRR